MRGASTRACQPVVVAVDADDAADLAHDPREHRIEATDLGLAQTASRAGRPRRPARARARRGRAASGSGPDHRRALSRERPARRTRAAGRRAPPRGTTSRASGRPRGGATGRLPRRARRARRASGPLRSSSSESVRERPAAEREPPRLPRDGRVARVEARRIGADGAHPDRDRVDAPRGARGRAVGTPRPSPSAGRAR